MDSGERPPGPLAENPNGGEKSGIYIRNGNASIQLPRLVIMHPVAFRKMIVVLLLVVCGLAGIVSAEDGLIGGGTGYFQISSTPSGADVIFDDSYKGTTPVTVGVSSTGTPSHTIRITKSGYEDWEQSYDSNPFAGETIHVSATLTPVIGGGKGYYSISSSPSGANVYFDGSYKGTTPLTVEVSSTGTPGHTIRLTLSGYQEWSQYYSGNPSDGQTIYVSASMTPVQNYGSITVTSSPSGATAVLDGSNSQITPCTFHNVVPGSHTIQVTKSGYSTWSTTTSVSAGLNTQVYASLSTLPPTTGSIYVTSVPSGANVYVDGTYYGPSPQIASGLSPGYHQVRISLSGFQDWTGSVYVHADETTKVSQALSVGPTPTSAPGTGSVSVSSNPAGAGVYLDNVYVGITPLTIPGVSSGSHVVLLTHQGYANWQATVQVQQGVTETVDATLSPSPTLGPTRVSLPAFIAVISLGILALAFFARKG